MPEPRMQPEASAQEPRRATPQEIKRRMDRGEPVMFLDCRNEEAWQRSSVKLPGALRVPADRVDQHLNEIPRSGAVFTYCT